MPNLASALLGALDEVERLKSLLEILDFSLEQLGDLSGTPPQRVEFLLSNYRANLELHLHELETHLRVAHKLVFPPKSFHLKTCKHLSDRGSDCGLP